MSRLCGTRGAPLPSMWIFVSPVPYRATIRGSSFDKSSASTKRDDVRTSIAWPVKASMPVILPVTSMSRRKRSRPVSNARRSPSRSLVMPLRIMSSREAASGFSGDLPTPKNPGPDSL